MSDDSDDKENTAKPPAKKGGKLFGRLFGYDDDKASEEEIINLLNQCLEKGIIESSAKNMIENIFNFDDTTVNEIMTHRKDIAAVEDTATLKQAVERMIDTGYSRIPVYHGDTDNIIGVLYAKDLLKYTYSDVPKDFKLTDITREVFYVPSLKNCNQLFAEMTASKVQLAIVVDEYGGTNGLITLEDLVESIVGSIQDEYDDEEEEVRKINEKAYTVDGSADIEQVSELIGKELPDDESDTIAGLMLERLDKIPQGNEKPSVEIGDVKFTVTKMENRRIARVLIEILR